MSADHRAERLDHQSLGDRFELPRHALGIRLGVGVPDDHTQSLAAIQRARHFNDTVECAVESAHPLERGDEAVSDAEHRLHLQHRPEQRARAADAATTPQELESGDREIRLHVLAHVVHLGHDRFRPGALRDELGGGECQQPERHRGELRVDHVHTLRVGHLRALHSGCIGAAQPLRDVDRDDRFVSVQQLRVRFGKTSRRGLRRCRVGRRVRQFAVELSRPDVDAVEQRAPFEVESQWNDGDASRPRELRR